LVWFIAPGFFLKKTRSKFVFGQKTLFRERGNATARLHIVARAREATTDWGRQTRDETRAESALRW
jgi:hypothetical protein